MDDINLEEYAERILQSVDYDIYKEDVYEMDKEICEGIEAILCELVQEVRTNCE